MSHPQQPGTLPVSDARTWMMFLFMAAIWGSSFLFIRTALDEGVAPLTVVSMRTLFGALFLVLVMLAQGGRLPRGWDVWKRFAILGLVNIVVPFTLISWGQQYIPSGMAAILNAMVPLFTIVLAAAVLHDEAITLAKLAGLAIGFGGVVLLALPSLGAADGDDETALALMAMLAVVLATVSYAIAAVFTRRQLSGRVLVRTADGGLRPPSPLEIALGSTVVGFLTVILLAVVFERPDGGLLAIPQTGAGWFSVLWLGVLGTGLAYLLFFRIMGRWGATRTTLVTYVTPIVAVTLGFAFLDERLRPIEIAGAVLIISGVVLINAPLGQRPLFTRSTAESPTEP